MRVFLIYTNIAVLSFISVALGLFYNIHPVCMYELRLKGITGVFLYVYLCCFFFQEYRQWDFL